MKSEAVGPHPGKRDPKEPVRNIAFNVGKGPKVFAACLALAAAAGLLLVGSPTLEERLDRLEPELEARLQERRVQIDPAELLALLDNNNLRLRILDVRDEADFNLFHIVDAERTPLEKLLSPAWVKRLPKETVIVLVSNDEGRASEAWKLLTVQKVENLYILEGGVNHWLDVYGAGGSRAEAGAGPLVETAAGDSHAEAGAGPLVEAAAGDARAEAGAGPLVEARPRPEETLRHTFAAALGSRHPAADPDPGHAPRRSFEKKVKDIGRSARKTGGCG